MVEILIALVLSMLLAIALFTVLHSTLYDAISQRGMSALQQSERQAATIMRQVANSAGYFVVTPTNGGAATPGPSLTVANALPVSPPFATAGQYIYGTTNNPVSAGDVLDIRFESALSSNANEPSTINCLGQTAPTTTPVLYTNSFYVDPTTSSLDCSVNGGTPQILVGDGTNGGTNVQSMTVLYGVDTNGAGSVTRYESAMNVTNWAQVLSAQITLTFVNPLYNAHAANGQPATLNFSYLVNFIGAGGGS